MGKMVKIDEAYRPSDEEPFMNERQREYYRRKLTNWKSEILREAQDTLVALQTESENHPDLADRASSETDRAIEPRSMPRSGASTTAPTAIARRPASRSRCAASKPAR